MVTLLVFLLLALFFLPGWMRSLFRRSALTSTNVQVVLLLGFELCLGFSVFLAFFSAWFSYWLTVDYLAPWATGLTLSGDFWDAPLTPRGMLFLAIVVSTPLVVFFRLGLLSVRDAHQVCKEQLDRVKKRHHLSFFWKGF